ncbi:unnamed protein product [Amoebophrya sp. A25]|nr:unnamed protein product [Amoebophrya sp. A25]|eukprot:GSA25T00006590001.1
MKTERRWLFISVPFLGRVLFSEGSVLRSSTSRGTSAAAREALNCVLCLEPLLASTDGANYAENGNYVAREHPLHAFLAPRSVEQEARSTDSSSTTLERGQDLEHSINLSSTSLGSTTITATSVGQDLEHNPLQLSAEQIKPLKVVTVRESPADRSRSVGNAESSTMSIRIGAESGLFSPLCEDIRALPGCQHLFHKKCLGNHMKFVAKEIIKQKNRNLRGRRHAGHHQGTSNDIDSCAGMHTYQCPLCRRESSLEITSVDPREAEAPVPDAASSDDDSASPSTTTHQQESPYRAGLQGTSLEVIGEILQQSQSLCCCCFAGPASSYQSAAAQSSLVSSPSPAAAPGHQHEETERSFACSTLSSLSTRAFDKAISGASACLPNLAVDTLKLLRRPPVALTCFSWAQGVVIPCLALCRCPELACSCCVGCYCYCGAICCELWGRYHREDSSDDFYSPASTADDTTDVGRQRSETGTGGRGSTERSSTSTTSQVSSSSTSSSSTSSREPLPDVVLTILSQEPAAFEGLNTDDLARLSYLSRSSARGTSSASTPASSSSSSPQQRPRIAAATTPIRWTIPIAHQRNGRQASRGRTAGRGRTARGRVGGTSTPLLAIYEAGESSEDSGGEEVN